MDTLTRILITIVGCVLFTNQTGAQSTNPCPVAPATQLESFETNIAVVILKATTELGSVPAKAGVVAVKYREVTDTSTGQKAQGLAIEITEGRLKDTLLVDYEEIVPLLNAMDYLGKLDISVTPLNALDAIYTTKGGLRVAALGTRRTGAMQFGVRDVRTNWTPIIFTRQEMTVFSSLVNQAKTALDSLRG